MTMTSNYDEYVRPEVWPVPAEEVASIHTGARRRGGDIEIRCWAAFPHGLPPRIYILDVVPEHAHAEALQAILDYVMACRKLIG